jgi:hypothetical protein
MMKMEEIDDDEDEGNPSKAIQGTDGDGIGLDPSSSVPAMMNDEEQATSKTITDKEFYKAMQKLKDRGTNAVPPKKSASAYILFGKEVSF